MNEDTMQFVTEKMNQLFERRIKNSIDQKRIEEELKFYMKILEVFKDMNDEEQPLGEPPQPPPKRIIKEGVKIFTDEENRERQSSKPPEPPENRIGYPDCG